MSKEKSPRTTMDFPIINPHAAGADIGSERIFVAVPPDGTNEEVRCFRTFTQDLREAAQWMREAGVTTVAIESTSVYWIPFTQILEDNGIRVSLVNPRHVKNVPAAFKTDRRDARWLRNLHAVGLLSASFRPDQQVCAVRSITRHKDNLGKQASRCILHMQKALTQMNILVHEVISDITGVSGLAILDAILAGDRSPAHLCQLCDPRIKASEEDIKKALVGDWREEHLFTLRQSLATWRHFQSQIDECDAEISRLMSEFDPVPASSSCSEQLSGPPSTLPRQVKMRKPNSIGAIARAREREKQAQLTRIFGIDVTEIPGIAVGTAEVAFTEVGTDFTRFHSGDHFASWLGLAPDNNESGGKILSRKTRRTRNRLAIQLRLSANTLTRSDTYLGAYLRKTKSRLGAPKGITATARKLAIILYTLITEHTPYDESVFAREQERHRERHINHLRREAQALGYDFVERPCVS